MNYYSKHDLNGDLTPDYDSICTELSPKNLNVNNAYSKWDKTLDGIIKVAQYVDNLTLSWDNEYKV